MRTFLLWLDSGEIRTWLAYETARRLIRAEGGKVAKMGPSARIPKTVSSKIVTDKVS
jgi:hypothetical protein